MADSSAASSLRVTRLIVVPTVITLAVTFLRLIGELLHWSSLFFNRSAGGGFAIVGISWLPIIFGPYFAVKIAKRGGAPVRFGKGFGFAALGVIVFLAGSFVAFAPGTTTVRMLAGFVLMVAAAMLQFVPWRDLARTLLAYAYAARVPVVIVMFFAMRGNWGTHYDALPSFPVPGGFWSRYLYLALIPQFVMWIAYTIVLGALIGTAYLAIVRRKKSAPAAPGA